MSSHVESIRHSCALHGALDAVQAVEGAVAVLHATSGCGVQRYLAGGAARSGGSGYAGGLATPSTNVGERHVVFGGTSRLREQLKNAVRVMRGDLYVVISGCAPELVGDDADAMVREVRDQGYPVLSISAPGFKGLAHQGHQVAVKALLGLLAPAAAPERTRGRVNVLGIVPGQDATWRGDLVEIKALLAGIGVEAATLFGVGEGLDAWRRAAAAELNLSFSPWGDEIARHLEKVHGTPHLSFPGLPIGPDAAGALLGRVGERLALDPSRIAAVRAREETRFHGYLEAAADAILAHGLQREFAFVGPASLAAGVTGFLAGVGLAPTAVVVTDVKEEVGLPALSEALGRIVPELSDVVYFGEDGSEIADLLRERRPELLVGSGLERSVARDLGVPLLEVAGPVRDRLILGRSYVGDRGGVALIEDLSREILSADLAADVTARGRLAVASVAEPPITTAAYAATQEQRT